MLDVSKGRSNRKVVSIRNLLFYLPFDFDFNKQLLYFASFCVLIVCSSLH